MEWAILSGESNKGSRIDWHNPPKGPENLGPDWKETTDPRNQSGNREFKNEKTGETIRWDKGKDAVEQEPHWHRYNSDKTSRHDEYLDIDNNPVASNSEPSHIYPKSDVQNFLDGAYNFFFGPRTRETVRIPGIEIL